MDSVTSKILKTGVDVENLKVVDSQVVSPIEKSNTVLDSEEYIQHHKALRNQLKIDVKEQLAPPQIAWSMVNSDGTESILGTLGDFGMIIGKAKSRKSFFINIAVSCALSNDTLLGKFKSYLPTDRNDVLYFDTEQSKYDVQRATKRICKQIGVEEPKNLHVFHLRSLSPFERLRFIEAEIYLNDKASFVIIDGIKDLVKSINDESEATEIASKLLKWTEERNIYILNVLHQNKTDANARGHIGTELQNKAQTVLSVSKSEGDKNISVVTPEQCRNIEPEVFAFEINEDGLPIIAENFEVRTETKANRFDPIDLERFKKYQLLTEVFSKKTEISYKELQIQLQLAYKNQFDKKLSDANSIKLITDCKNCNWLFQEKPKAPYTLKPFESENDSF